MIVFVVTKYLSEFHLVISESKSKLMIGLNIGDIRAVVKRCQISYAKVYQISFATGRIWMIQCLALVTQQLVK